MKTMNVLWLAAICSIFCISVALSQNFDWNFLDTKTIGAQKFIKENPECDGRGVIIFILDTGVDPAINGLNQTSDGKVKVIDMKDFTGQTVLELQPAELKLINGDSAASTKDNFLKGYNKLALKPIDGKYFLALLDEDKCFKNSEVKDINKNGKNDDLMLFLVFKTKISKEMIDGFQGHVKPAENSEIWVYYPDTDMNGSIDEEKAMFDYKYNYDVFSFVSPISSKTPPYTMSAYVENNNLIINTNDGAHGSHCAGIAAGYKIYGADGNNGIAPGAYIASLKLGNNQLSGGSTTTESMKKAYLYGIDFMKEAGFKYAVFSMSYGIDSETPSKSEADEFLEDFAYSNPNVIISKSMGNSGPGINTTGNPVGTSGPITVGAMISPETLRDLYGSKRNKAWITHFSSRGGETAKPDVVAPGAAQSTVPDFNYGEAFWGTSMSTPEVAGVAAVLISAAEKNNLQFDAQMVKRAIKYSAEPMSGYSIVDYGCGLVNVQKAFDYLKILSKRDESKKVLDFEITTENTFYSDLTGPAAFWKANGWIPDSKDRVLVSVKAIFPKDMDESVKSNFYRAWNLKSTAQWLSTDKSSFYMRANQNAIFNLIIDKSKIQKPGVYSAKILAYTGNEPNGGYADFDVQATVVVPYKFGIENDYNQNLTNRTLDIGDIDRIFVQTPPAASAMNIKLTPQATPLAALYLFNPEGEQQSYSISNDGSKIQFALSGSDISSGIWEAIPYCFYRSSTKMNYDLQVKFYGIKSEPQKVDSYEYKIGKKPEFKLRFFNEFETTIEAKINAGLYGYKSTSVERQSSPAGFSKSISVDNNISTYAAKIVLPEEVFNKTTDIPVLIKDSTGKAIVSSGISRKSGSISFQPTPGAIYTLEIQPAFLSNATVADGWQFELCEKYYYKNGINIRASDANIRLIPGIWQERQFTLDEPPPALPDGTCAFGTIKFFDKVGNYLVKEINIEIKK